MPSPQEAAAILKAGMDSGFDPVKLALRRKALADELTRNRELEQSSTNDALRSRVDSRFASPSERTRDEMMGWDLGPSRTYSGATPSDVSSLEDDIHNDPFTGDAEQSRIGGIQKSIDAANTTMRDDVGQAADTTAKRNAFAKFMESEGQSRGQALGKARGEWSPEYQKAADAAHRRAIEEKEAGRGATFDDLGAGNPTARQAPMNAADSKSITSYHDQASLANDVLPIVRKLAGASDEYNSGSFLGKLPGLAESTWQNTLYKHGIAPAEVSAALQRIGLAQAKGVASFAGRPTAQWIDLLSQHMAKPGLPWREEERRLAAMTEGVEGMPAILPEMEQNLYDARAGKRLAPSAPPQSANRINDPNWGAR